MEDKIRAALDSVEASERLKRSIKASVRRKTLDYGRDVTRLRQQRSGLAGCLVCLTLVLAGAGLWKIPVTSIGLDVNPSLELQINSFDRVIRLNGCNEDGTALADRFHLEGRPYDEAVQRLLISDDLAPYLENGSTFVITVSGSDDAHTLQMLNKVACRAYSLAEDEKVFCIRADGATAKAAGRVGLSVARYQAWQILLQDNPLLPPAAVLELTVEQIQELIHGENLENPCGE